MQWDASSAASKEPQLTFDNNDRKWKIMANIWKKSVHLLHPSMDHMTSSLITDVRCKYQTCLKKSLWERLAATGSEDSEDTPSPTDPDWKRPGPTWSHQSSAPNHIHNLLNSWNVRPLVQLNYRIYAVSKTVHKPTCALDSWSLNVTVHLHWFFQIRVWLSDPSCCRPPELWTSDVTWSHSKIWPWPRKIKSSP